MSAKGSALVARLIARARDIEADAAAGLSPEELAVVKRCLRRIYANMKSRPAAAESRRAG
jgi:DNA-binding MarR family transcriptional regulator